MRRAHVGDTGMQRYRCCIQRSRCFRMVWRIGLGWRQLQTAVVVTELVACLRADVSALAFGIRRARAATESELVRCARVCPVDIRAARVAAATDTLRELWVQAAHAEVGDTGGRHVETGPRTAAAALPSLWAATKDRAAAAVVDPDGATKEIVWPKVRAALWGATGTVVSDLSRQTAELFVITGSEAARVVAALGNVSWTALRTAGNVQWIAAHAFAVDVGL